MNKIYFVSDTHFGHKNIIKYSPWRLHAIGVVRKEDKYYKDSLEIPLDQVIKLHDEWVIKSWNLTIDKKDTIFMLGDFSFHNTDDTQKIFHRLNGNKRIVFGNHDDSAHRINGWGTTNDLVSVIFKKKHYDFLEENFKVVMCHFPLLSWEYKQNGSVNLHGHSHGSLDEYNNSHPDLRVDVGFDGKFFFPDLETIYKYFKDIASKAGCKTLSEYAKTIEGQIDMEH